MADPFTAEVRAFCFNFAPANWAFCNGQQVQISQNSTLFALLGTTYGGNGTTNFNLPNLQGCTPIDAGQGTGLTARILGSNIGSAMVSLDTTEIPNHRHDLVAENPSDLTQIQQTPTSGSFLSRNAGQQIYSDQLNPDTSFDVRALGFAGGSQPHENRQPFLAFNFCICLYGEWPPHP